MVKFVDPTSLETNQERHTRVLIIGGGPAGLALSIRLSEIGIDHLIVESGDTMPGHAQTLADGLNIGLRFDDLIAARVRALGGTTHIWGGHTRLLEQIDFAKRSYVPYSGWPIKYADFREYGAKALKTLNLGDEWDPEIIGDYRSFWPDANTHFKIEIDKLSPVISNGRKLGKNRKGTYFQFNRPLIKGRILLNTTIRRLEFGETGRVLAARGVTSDGKELKLRADQYVVACGGIENARFLLMNRDLNNSPLRDLDKIGRFFMEHPHIRFGRCKTFAKPLRQITQRGFRHKDGGLWVWRFFLKEDVQRRHALPNIQFYLRVAEGQHQLNFSSLCEQAPNPSSRVGLSPDEVDRLGDPVTTMHYDLYDWEYERFYRAAQLLAIDMGMQGFGRVWLNSTPPGDYEKSSVWLGAGHHHMGTTRMGWTAKDSVVDDTLKLWGIPNLYVAGSSVFPTSGAVNPTANLIMLSLRLGDHLSDKLQ